MTTTLTTPGTPGVTPGTVREIPPETVANWLKDEQAFLLDVREAGEHATERIAGAKLVPLSSFKPATLAIPEGRKLVLHCKSGMRSRQAAGLLAQVGVQEIWNMAGGIEGLKRAGLPTAKPGATETTPCDCGCAAQTGGHGFDVMRQTQMTIGVMVLTGVLLGHFVSPWFLILSGFMGCGLMMAGITGLCPLASFMAKMPWNRSPAANGACKDGASSCCSGTKTDSGS